MGTNQLGAYTQSLLERIATMTQEIDHLRSAYITVNNRLTNLSLHTERTIKELIQEASRVREFAELGVEATKLTEQSTLITNNIDLIEAAKKSALAASAVHQLTVDLITYKLPSLEIKKEFISKG